MKWLLAALVVVLFAVPAAAAPRYSIINLFNEFSFDNNDSTTTLPFYMFRAQKVHVFYSTKNGTALSGVDSRPQLDISNDANSTPIANPTLGSHGVHIIHEGNTASIRRTATITSNEGSTAGLPGMGINWQFGVLRFGPTASGTDTLSATAVVVWDDNEPVEEMGVLALHCNGVSGAKHIYVPQGSKGQVKVGMSVASENSAVVRVRTTVTAVTDTAVFISKTLNGALSNAPVWFTW